jgi:hypothetical protein
MEEVTVGEKAEVTVTKEERERIQKESKSY